LGKYLRTLAGASDRSLKATKGMAIQIENYNIAI
jgi:hypothetical protein